MKGALVFAIVLVGLTCVPGTARAEPPPPATAAHPVVEESVEPWRALGIGLFSLGGASLVAGAIVGGVAIHESAAAGDSLPASCVERDCLESDRTEIEAAYETTYQLAVASDGLFIAAGVAAVFGLVVWVVDPGGKTARPRPTRSGAGLELRF